jgi:hypothetical protein
VTDRKKYEILQAISSFRTLAYSTVHVKSHRIYVLCTGRPDGPCIGFDATKAEFHRISSGIIAEALCNL